MLLVAVAQATAEAAQATAEENVTRAVSSEGTAQAAQATVAAAAVTVEAQRQRSEVQRLSAVAINQLDVDPERGVLLALEAVRATLAENQPVLYEAEDALHRTVPALRTEHVLSGHRSPVFGVALSPDGVYLATVTWMTVTVWDAASGEPLSSLFAVFE